MADRKDHDITMAVKMGFKSFPGITDLAMGKSIDESVILPLCEFVDTRLDCADFRLITLLRVLHGYSDTLSPTMTERIKTSVLGFRYWMDEPGDDSLCWWSENHQILFFACQYLAGQLYPEERFSSGHHLGAEMKHRARTRILRWLHRRFEYGFVEWHSNTYYEEDAPPLANLVDFADDREIQDKAAIVLDLLFADMAMHSHRGLFCAASGRCYEDQKKHPLKQDILEMAEWAFGFGHVRVFDDHRICGNVRLSKRYRVPSILKEIAHDQGTAIVKSSMGLNLNELENELGDLMDVENAGYYIWAMEAFTNPETVRSTMSMFRRFGLHSNDFLKDFKKLNRRALWPILPTLARVLNPATNGVAIQRANTYTYRTADFMMSTAQAHHPGEFGDQQHIWQATLSPDITVFATHPGTAIFKDNARNFSPGSWVGNGIMPHAVQHENVVLAIYDTRGRKGFLEGERARFSHAYFPFDLFDEADLVEDIAFGRIGGTMVALMGFAPLELRGDEGCELIQQGQVTAWICEVSTVHKEFTGFKADLAERDRFFDGKTLTYTGQRRLELRYKGDFRVDGTRKNLDYPRLDSPYGQVERKPEDIRFRFGYKELHLNIKKRIREEIIHD